MRSLHPSPVVASLNDLRHTIDQLTAPARTVQNDVANQIHQLTTPIQVVMADLTAALADALHGRRTPAPPAPAPAEPSPFIEAKEILRQHPYLKTYTRLHRLLKANAHRVRTQRRGQRCWAHKDDWFALLVDLQRLAFEHQLDQGLPELPPVVEPAAVLPDWLALGLLEEIRRSFRDIQARKVDGK